MFLIMSAAYVGQELQSEFGKLPPSFLPLGNKRLFHHQIALAPRDVDIYISIPDSFQVSPLDIQWLARNKITLLHVPEQLSLGASLVAALNLSGCNLNKPLHLLYGDTLYRKLPIGDDIASVSTAKNSYNWAILSNDSADWLKDIDSGNSLPPQKIIDGYFKFSNPRELVKSITQSNWDILGGLNLYYKSIGLSAVESSNWLDFGHVNTYYNSKAEFTTQRAFNELEITSKWVEKSSFKIDKIAAESYWFASLPDILKVHTPQYLGEKTTTNKVSYRLEYLHLTALNELFVFGKLPSNVWKQILDDCIDFLLLCRECPMNVGESSNSLDLLFSAKTKSRLAEYCRSQNISLDQKWTFENLNSVSLNDILIKSEQHLPKLTTQQSVLHGDFCFSNILYDFRSGKIKTIDPRGMTPDGINTIYGDIRYDIAKLSHSILGMYDWIIAGYYEVKVNDDIIELSIPDNIQQEDTQYAFIKLIEEKFQLTAENLYAMQIQLFLSMLPLHADDTERQKALFANTFRLYKILMRLE